MIALIALAAAILPAPKSLRCDFDNGVFHAWGEKTRITSDRLSLVFDNINIKAGTARLIGNAGTADVIALSADNRLSFVEVTNSGNVNLTSVNFDFDAALLKATHSRHVGTIAVPMSSQLYGTCRVYD